MRNHGSQQNQSQLEFYDVDLSQMIDYDTAKEAILASVSQQKLWKHKQKVSTANQIDLNSKIDTKVTTIPSNPYL